MQQQHCLDCPRKRGGYGSGHGSRHRGADRRGNRGTHARLGGTVGSCQSERE
jgi:hypothetical protein